MSKKPTSARVQRLIDDLQGWLLPTFMSNSVAAQDVDFTIPDPNVFEGDEVEAEDFEAAVYDSSLERDRAGELVAAVVAALEHDTTSADREEFFRVSMELAKDNAAHRGFAERYEAWRAVALRYLNRG